MATNTKWNFVGDKAQMLALGSGWDPENPAASVEKWRTKKAKDAEQIVKQLRLEGDDIVGEIGSGLGIVARRVAQVAKHVYCGDVSEIFLAKCREELVGVDNTTCIVIHPSDLSAFNGLGINKIFAEGVFIHFNLFDIVIYLEQIHTILPSGGLFRFDIMNADLPDLTKHWHFLQHLTGYRSNKENIFNCLYWNSVQTVKNIAEQIGFNVEFWGLENINGYVGFLIEKR